MGQNSQKCSGLRGIIISKVLRFLKNHQNGQNLAKNEEQTCPKSQSRVKEVESDQ